jgi:acetoin utilization deacetylase AcuC-like enzyme
MLERAPIAGTRLTPGRPATEQEIGAIHSARLREEIRSSAGKAVEIDADTRTSPESYAAAVLAAGTAVAAVEAVMQGQAANAFALLRPPGHHATPNQAMGFCLFNNIAIAAEAARQKGAKRVLILDWDVHHGNGTQDAFYERPDVLYVSSHEYPLYPGTGAPSEVGAAKGAGYTVNCALPAGGGDAEYGAVFHDLFLPISAEFAPDIVLVSAGFDAHRADPLANMCVSERGFSAMCSQVVNLANGSCGGKVVLMLEGGYARDALALSVHACLEVLRGRKEDFVTGVSPSGARALRASQQVLRPYWKHLSVSLP